VTVHQANSLNTGFDHLKSTSKVFAGRGLRARVEQAIEELIALLDRADGDCDIELNGDEMEDSEGDYSSGWMHSTSWAPAGACEDDEDDFAPLPRKAA
jgi:hypothetical protein